MAAHDAYEQYLLELINRARLDPASELARYNSAVASGAYSGTSLTNLNSGLAPGTISGAALQVLAPSSSLELASSRHSQHMLAVDRFAHSGIGDGDVGTRAVGAGYNFNWLGENISWSGTTGTINVLKTIQDHHFGLFRSDGHRSNLMNASFSEGGMAREIGQYTQGGTTYNASMLTEMFGTRTGAVFVTGVVYSDTDNDRFYSIGEGAGGVSISSGISTVSASAGGYGLQLTVGLKTIAIGGAIVKLNIAGDNIKLDLVSGNKIHVSGNVELVSGVVEVNLLGVANLTATGAAGAQTLNGNRGNNTLNGMDGADRLFGLAGNDTLNGGLGNDLLVGGAGIDIINGGDGIDSAYYYSSAAAVVVNLATGIVSGGEAAGDRLTSIENVYGSNIGADTLTGNTLANSLYGFGGGDILNGGLGNDALLGGLGNDRLTGGAGSDTFYFNTALNAVTNLDVITDFNVIDDTIRLENTGIFAALGVATGVLNAAMFKDLGVAGAVLDADDRIIYNRNTGVLLYDIDGSGILGSTQFATLTVHPALTNADFVVF